jgi:hypothetical protein
METRVRGEQMQQDGFQLHIRGKRQGAGEGREPLEEE